VPRWSTDSISLCFLASFPVDPDLVGFFFSGVGNNEVTVTAWYVVLYSSVVAYEEFTRYGESFAFCACVLELMCASVTSRALEI
jgi:hypothetical protein